MSGEIHDWLADLRDSDPPAARRVGQALAALMAEGSRLSDPLVVSTEDFWPEALIVALDRSYSEDLQRLALLRRGASEAASLVSDIQKHVAELESAHATREEVAELRQLLPGVITAQGRLDAANTQLQSRFDSFRSAKKF
jgi:hypothetical protein